MIGIVASRIAERHHRPAVLIALDGEEGTGSGRSIPAFDLLGGLDAASAHLLRHGGHRAAAGCTIAAGAVDAFRAAFVAHAEASLAPEDLVPVQRVDAVVPGDALALPLAEELAAARAVRHGQPRAVAARPERAARRSAADGGGPPRLLHARGGRRALALRRLRARQLAAGRARRAGRRRRPARGQPLQRRGRAAARAPPRPAGPAGADPRGRRARARGGAAAPSCGRPRAPMARRARDLRFEDDLRGRRRRPRPAAGARASATRAAAASPACWAISSPAARRCSPWPPTPGTARAALQRSRRRLRRHDLGRARARTRRWPPAMRTWSRSTRPRTRRRARWPSALPGDGWVHLAWGDAERTFAARVLAWELDLRAPLAEAYRALRGRRAPGGVRGRRSSDAARSAGRRSPPRSRRRRAAAPRRRRRAGCCACSRSWSSSVHRGRRPARRHRPAGRGAHGARAVARLPRLHGAARGRARPPRRRAAHRRARRPRQTPRLTRRPRPPRRPAASWRRETVVRPRAGAPVPGLRLTPEDSWRSSRTRRRARRPSWRTRTRASLSPPASRPPRRTWRSRRTSRSTARITRTTTPPEAPADLTAVERELLADLFAIVEEHADEVARPVDRRRLVDAFVFACEHHADQRRQSGEDFIVHPGRRGEDLRGHAARHRDAVRRAPARHGRGHDGEPRRGPRGLRRGGRRAWSTA